MAISSVVVVVVGRLNELFLFKIICRTFLVVCSCRTYLSDFLIVSPKFEQKLLAPAVVGCAVVVSERVVVVVVFGRSGAFYRIQPFCSYLWNDLAYLKNETCGEVSECEAKSFVWGDWF